MQQVADQILRFLQQGIAAIFQFVSLIWNWAAAQVSALTQVPWQEWPAWKQVFIALIAVAVAIALLRALSELWVAGERILAAFATLLVALVKTLPPVAAAGAIALGGIWVVNRVDLGDVRLPTLAWHADEAPQQR